MDFFKIETDNFNYYTFFYITAYFAGFLLLLAEGYHRKFPIRRWMLVIATSCLFFMLGCRFIAFSTEEWQSLIHLKPVNYTTARSVLGGIIFSVVGIALAGKSLGFRLSMADAFASSAPFGLVLQRLGCLMAGCCHGTPTELPWAIQYQAGSHAYMDHINNGWLTGDAALSLPVHPVQLYEAICCIAIVIILVKLRNRLLADGNLFLTSILLYAGFRFFLEFFRAPAGHASGGGNIVGGLNIVQWIILTIVPFLFFLIRHREEQADSVSPSPTTSGLLQENQYLLILCLVSLATSRWLDLLDIVCFNLILLPVVAWLVIEWFTLPGARLARIIFPGCALLLMSQTYPELSSNDSTKLSYTSLGIGMMSGFHDLASTSKDCNGSTISTSKFRHDYTTGSLGISRTIQTGPKEAITFGLNSWKGVHHEDVSVQFSGSQPGIYNNTTYDIYGVQPYFQFDSRRVGIGAGYNFGNMTTIVSPDQYSSVKELNKAPSYYFRYGNRSVFFLEFRMGNQFPGSFPAMQYQGSLGLGLGKSTFRLGTSTRVRLFLTPTIPIKDHFVLEPFIGFETGGNGFEQSGSGGIIGAVSLHYKINKKLTPLKSKSSPR